MPFEREQMKSGAPRWRRAAQVRFQEVDAAGVVFFAWFFEMFHDAYAEFLASRGFPLEAMLREPWKLPLKHAEADYLRPLRLGERFEVIFVAAVLHQSEVELGWRVSSRGDQVVHALGRTVHACVDGQAFRGLELPQAVREVFQPLAD